MTPEEITAEIEKCRLDPVYTFNTYFRRSGQPEMTKEIWNEYKINLFIIQLKPRRMSEQLREYARKALTEAGELLI